MQIILLDKVPNLGALGDVISVKDGYARNYLIPSNRARRATTAAKAEFEMRRTELEAAAAAKLTKAQTIAEKLTEVALKLSQKAGVDGRLFGSVTNANIAEELNKLGYEVAKVQVRMPDGGSIKTTGDYFVNIALHSDIEVRVAVSIYGETS